MNALGLLAAPKAWATAAERTEEALLRQGVVECIDESWRELSVAEGPVELVTGGATPLVVEPLGRIKEAAESWSERAPSAQLVDLARACLTALGVPEPDDGWEHFNVDDV